MSNLLPPTTTSYEARIDFVVELAERLHLYGTTAQRLEGALIAVAQRLELECEAWTSPTALILTFSDPLRPPGDRDTTRVIRVPPGENDLHRLSETDRIAEAVLANEIDLIAGHAALRALDTPRGQVWHAMQVLGFGLAAGSVGGGAKVGTGVAPGGVSTGGGVAAIGVMGPMSVGRISWGAAVGVPGRGVGV